MVFKRNWFHIVSCSSLVVCFLQLPELSCRALQLLETLHLSARRRPVYLTLLLPQIGIFSIKKSVGVSGHQVLPCYSSRDDHTCVIHMTCSFSISVAGILPLSQPSPWSYENFVLWFWVPGDRKFCLSWARVWGSARDSGYRTSGCSGLGRARQGVASCPLYASLTEQKKGRRKAVLAMWIGNASFMAQF